MVPMIVRVYGEADDGSDGAVLLTDVPVTPHTTCRDVIECCRDPGEDPCTLVETWGGCERPLREDERPLEILQEWGSHQDQVKFVLRYTVLPPTAMNGGRPDTRNGMKEPGPFGELLPEGVELTLGELQEMATRQQHQIDSQHQLLVAKEQRLRYLKQQEVRHQQVAAENERLRRLRDRVEAQELKLRKLRALRGQVDQTKLNNASLTSDLDSIRALFNEKEKELSVAVAKVEELTQQLEELRRGRGGTREQQPPHQSPAALELDKLRRELMYRNKLNEQQNARLSQQREVLSQKQEEMSNIDKRISELQDRLHRKRLLNTQLTNQINATSLKSSLAASGQQPPLRSAASATTIQQQQHPAYSHQQPTKSGKLLRPMTTGNIAAIEPYHHVPVSDCEKHRHHLQDDKMILSQDDFHTKLIGSGNNAGIHNGNLSNKSKDKDEQFLPEFAGSKSDPKYQTLPYNTKFTVNFVSTAGTKVGADKQDLDGDTRRNSDAFETTKNNNNNLNTINNNNHLNYPSQQQQQQHLMTVHSIPLPTLTEVSKGLATPLSQHHGEQSAYQQQLASKAHGMGHLGPRPFGSTHSTYIQPGLTRGQPVGGSSSSTSSTSSLATNSSSGSSVGHQVAATPTITVHATSTTRTVRPLGYGVVLPPTPLTLANQKPVSSVAPTTVQHQKPSPIYQTSSTKIHPVQPHILSSTPQGILKDLRGELSPPQSSSTPLNTPESYTSQESRVGKPALPPKPAVPVKPTPPPRQTQHGSEENRLGHSYPDPYSQHLSKPVCHQQVLFSGSSIHSNEPEDPPPLPASDPPDEATLGSQRRTGGVGGNCDPLPIIKARPLTIKKQPASEQPRLKTGSGGAPSNVHVSINRRIEMPPAFFFPESEAPPADLVSSSEQSTFSSTQSGSSQNSVETSSSVSIDEVDRTAHDSTNEELENNNVRTPALGEECNRADKGEEDKPQTLNNINSNQEHSGDTGMQHIVRRGTKKGNLKAGGGKEPGMGSRRVSFDPLALLLDASLEGELELVRKTASQVANPSAANDEGITALHNAICAGHLDIVMFLVEFGCDVNAQDSDGWTPLHCAASCNNLSMVRFLVEHGACIFATTLSDHETAAEKCEEDEEGFDGCSEYLYSVQEKLGILNGGVVYAVYSYENHNLDELSFKEGEKLVVLRKGDECEREWWWSRLDDREGYIPRNLLGLYPRVHPPQKPE